MIKIPHHNIWSDDPSLNNKEVCHDIKEILKKYIAVKGRVDE
jgi:hypothetical protein